METTHKKNVLITGGTGFIGKKLTKLLLSKGYSISILTRSNRQNTDSIFYYQWDIAKDEIEEEAVLRADYIIHLVGASIAGGRWTEQRKKLILSSRLDSLALLQKVLEKHGKKLEGFVSASAVGYYGAITSEEICTEDKPPANDFVGNVCQQWEHAADQVANLGIRTVKIRTGLVFGKNGGFLERLVPVFKYGFGAAIGSGKQYMPWIHIADLCTIYLKAIEDTTMFGAFNAAVEDNTTNKIFSQEMAKVYGYKLWLPNIPSFIIKLAFGEMSKIVLEGQRTSSKKIKSQGFKFEYTNLTQALRNCLQ